MPMVSFDRIINKLQARIRQRQAARPAYDRLKSADLIPLLIKGIYQQRLSENSAVTIVQIGANDGLKDDPLCQIIGQPGVQALLVEPQPECAQKLINRYKTNPNIIIDQRAVGSSGGELTLFRFEHDVENGKSISVFCSADRQHLELWKNRLGIASAIISFQVEMLNLSEIINQANIADIDILMTDVEGMDYQILHPYLRQAVSLPCWLAYEKCNLSVEEQASLASVVHDRGGVVYDFGMDALACFKN